MDQSDYIEPSSSKVREETGENEPVLNSHDVLETLLSIMKNMEINLVRSWHSKLHQPIRLQNNHIIQQYVKSFIIPQYLMDSIKGLTSSHVVKIAAFFEKQFYSESETFESYRTSAINFNQIRTAFINLIKLSRDTYQKKKGIRLNKAVREERGIKEKETPISNNKPLPPNEKELDEPFNGPNRCSRVFILYALRKLRERARNGAIRDVLTADKDIINTCVEETFHQCQNDPLVKDDHAVYGGSCFSTTDNATYWTNGDQLLDWWVKNIENKQVLSQLVQNASYNGQRIKKFQKKHWSEAVIEVVTELKQLQHKDAEMSNSTNVKPRVPTDINVTSIEQAVPHETSISSIPRPQNNTNTTSNNGTSSNTVSVGGVNPAMPAEKLHHVLFLFQLHDALVNESPQILGFNENNIVFAINDIETFSKVIMPKYFKDMTFDAFQNQLNQLHFSIMRNPNSCYYYQRLFQKNRKDLIQQIPDSSSTLSSIPPSSSSLYNGISCNKAALQSQNQRSNTSSIAPPNSSTSLSSIALGNSSQSTNSPAAEQLLPDTINQLPVQQQIMQMQSQLISLIYNSILSNSLNNGASWNSSALASLFPSIGTAPVPFPLPEPYNSVQSFPGFQQGNFNGYNPWINSFQPTLSGLYQNLQQQSTTPQMVTSTQNIGNPAGQNPTYGPESAPYPSYAKVNPANSIGSVTLPPASTTLLPNSKLTPNSGIFHGPETLSSIQLPNLTNVTMASKMANEIALNNGSSHLRLNHPPTNWYQQQSNLLSDMASDSLNKNLYLKTYEPTKEPTDSASIDRAKEEVKSKKRSNTSANASTTASARASDDNSSEDASNQRTKRRKKGSRTNTNTISDKILRSIPAPILSHALIQSSLAFNRAQQLDDDSELEEELHSIDAHGELGEDEEEDEHPHRSGKNHRNSKRHSSGKKVMKEQETGTMTTALKAAVKGSYEDIIDLRKVGGKRIFIDFTLKSSHSSDPQHFPAALFSSVEPNGGGGKEKAAEYVCAYFHGKLIPNDECTIYKFGNIRSSSQIVGGSADDGNNTQISNDSNGSITSSSLASADRSEHSRVGPEYQAEIPEFLSRKQLVQNRPKNIESNRVWLCSAIDEDDLENIIEVLYDRKKSWIPTVGLVYTVYFPNVEEGQSRYRLCAVLEALTTPNSSARGRKSRGNSATFRVHDGKAEVTVTLDQFVRYLHKDEESLLDFIHEKQYETEDVLENYDLDRIGNDKYESFHLNWTMKEVEHFLIGFRKHHDIRRIWQISFQSTKTYKEIVKFYHDIHPFLVDNRIELLMTLYYHAEAAKLQVPVETFLENSSVLGTANKNIIIPVSEGGAYPTRSRRQYMKSSNNEETANSSTANSAVNSKSIATTSATVKQVPSLARNNDKYPTIIASNGHFGTLSLVFDSNYVFPERGSRNQHPQPGQAKDGKGKSNSSSSSQIDERSLPISTYFGRRMFCICRTPINDTERYIRCKVAKPSNCNGWVHLTCAGFGHLIDATIKKQPSKFREYICVKCKETIDNELAAKDDSSEQD